MKQQRTTRFVRARKRVVSIVLVGSLAMPVSLVLAISFPINRSESMPAGVYRYVSRPVQRGEIVGACVPERYANLATARGYLSFGICKGAIRPVMKYVGAIAGDIVEVRSSGVSINGVEIPGTALLRSDSLGRPLPNQLGVHILQPGEYWLLSNHDKGSFDSRYFGPVSGILGVVEPLLIRKSNEERPPQIDFQRIGASR